MRRVFLLAIALSAWLAVPALLMLAVPALLMLAVPALLMLGGTARGLFVLGVCVVFSAVVLAAVAANVRIARRARPAARCEDTRRTVETVTGTVPMTQAATEILLIPGSLALAFSAIAACLILIRTSAGSEI